jgi:hypothetical protein
MAKDPSTTARDLGYGEDDRVSSPVLSDWLVRELRRSRPPEPPPPVEAAMDPEPLPPANPSVPPLLFGAGVLAGSVVAAEAVASSPEPETLEAPEEPFADAAPSLPEEDDEAVDSFTPPRDFDALDEGLDDDRDATTAVAGASAADWLDDGPSFHPAGLFQDALDADADADLDEPAPAEAFAEETGTSLSPLTFESESEEEDDDHEAVLYVPGAAGAGSVWRFVAAAAVALLLLVFFFAHRSKTEHAATAATPPPAGEPAQAPAVEATPAEAAVEAPAAIVSGTHADLGGYRGHATPAADNSDPALPGGPSVARFPDLPREILNQLEQVFEANANKQGKSSTDSVDRYTH